MLVYVFDGQQLTLRYSPDVKSQRNCIGTSFRELLYQIVRIFLNGWSNYDIFWLLIRLTACWIWKFLWFCGWLIGHKIIQFAFLAFWLSGVCLIEAESGGDTTKVTEFPNLSSSYGIFQVKLQPPKFQNFDFRFFCRSIAKNGAGRGEKAANVLLDVKVRLLQA